MPEWAMAGTVDLREGNQNWERRLEIRLHYGDRDQHVQ